MKRYFQKIAFTTMLSIVSFGAVATINADDLLAQNDFNNGVSLPWNISESAEENSDFEVTDDGEFKVMVYNGGVNRWDVQFRHRGIVVEQGHTYTVKFTLRATKNTDVYAKIGQKGAPYKEYWNNNWTPFSLIAGQPLNVEQTFTMSDPTDDQCEFAFQVGGDLLKSGPVDIFLDNVYLSDPEFTAPDLSDTLPITSIRVNQVGYLPNGEKHATLVTSALTKQMWELKNSSDITIASGEAEPKGYDLASEDSVQIIDFSNVVETGDNFYLEVNGEKSFPFSINSDIYSKMRYDALSYFYQNRSGIEIKMPYAGRGDLTHPAGHFPDVAATLPGTGQPNYSLDVTGGWYDAGDHGKYVVNGGIALWTMVNQYEVAKLQGGKSLSSIADGTMQIPENSNGTPDILDEARWEIEFMLKMIVPDGNPLAGMAHHKIHDENWTELGLAPNEDAETRYLSPASTAATLNVAATAAQAARVYNDFDPKFATRCLNTAEKAWSAAVAHPAIYAPATSIGGGPYDDDYVLDEFYWAAAELYITTGKSVYGDYIKSSPHYLEMPLNLSHGDDGLTGVFTWGSTQGLGTISLALFGDNLSDSDRQQVKANITETADSLSEIIKTEGYLTPFRSSADGYPWGSNSFVVNDALLFGVANMITGNAIYFNAMEESMDYILGRNAMDQSYVTGYGSRELKNPHHRFWAAQANPLYPKAPAGAMSGGPNSGVQDSWAKGAGLIGKAPAKTFIDNIESWSTNEITINWNAPFAWVTAYLDNNSETNPTAINFLNGSTQISSVKSVGFYRTNSSLNFTNLTENSNRIKFIGINGRVIKSFDITTTGNNIHIPIENLKLATGVYILSINNSIQSFSTRLFMR